MFSWTGPPVGIPISFEKRNGVRKWEVISKNELGDSTVYNLLCSTNDTVIRKLYLNAPPDTSYDMQSIPFAIVVKPEIISVQFDKTVKYASIQMLPIPRFVNAGTSQLELNTTIYLNGTGLYYYHLINGGNYGGFEESLKLIE
jgi:hypothetical protein